MLTVMQQFIRPTSYAISLSFNYHSFAVVLVGPWQYPEGSPEIGFVHPSILPSVWDFLGIGSSDFPEFWHGDRDPYEVVFDRAGSLGKKIFSPKMWEMDHK